MWGSRISQRELERLAKRLDELRGVRESLGVSEIEVLTALISMDDARKIKRRVQRDRGELEEEDEDD